MEELRWLFEKYGLDLANILQWGGLVFIVVEWLKSEVPFITGWKTRVASAVIGLVACILFLGMPANPGGPYSFPSVPVLLVAWLGVFIVGAGINRGLAMTQKPPQP